jgi:hypothetical protein
MRAAYEAELSRITVTDMTAQAAVSLLNIAAHRLGAPRGSAPGAAAPGASGEQRDLEQVRDGIDAVRALLGILERRIPQEVRSLRDALSQLQMAYAAEVGGGAPASGTAAEPPTTQPGPPAPGAGKQPPGAGESEPGPGPAQASGRLWVPGR